MVLESDLRRLDDSIAADPSAPRVVGVRAPGGYGKTALLMRWAQIYREAGVPVYDGRHELPARDGAVLVDDAHQLDDERLRALRGLAASGSAQLAVAYRPWPRRAALTDLVDAVTRVRPPVLLGPLSRAQIGERAGLLLGAKPSEDLVDLVGRQTGGVPRFVDRLVKAVSETADCSVSAAAVEGFRYEVENLEDGVRRVLLATALGAGTDLLVSLLGLDLEALGDAMDGARASGLLDEYGVLLPIAQRALLALSPWERRLSLHQRLIEIQLARSGPLLPLVRPLLGAPVSGPLFASAFKKAGDEALAESPALAAQLFTAAVDAGEPALALAARRAEAAALSGDLDSGLRLADQAIAAEAAADRAHGASVAAAVLAHRGLLSSSTEFYRWAGEGSAVPFAALGLIGTGRLAEADELLSRPGSGGPPTLLAGAARQLAQGVRESVAGSATTALATLTRAAVLIEPLGRNVLLPDTPAALAALVAMHCGEFTVAEAVLRRAVDSGMGGAIAVRRHLLLRGWTAMLRGGFDAARSDLVAATSSGAMEPRDWLLATGLEVGLARRDSDLSALRTVWDRAREAIVRHPADLFALLPLGELAVAAGRLHDSSRLAPHLAQATELLGQLGNPPLWSTSLAWSRMHAAVLDEHPEDAARHAADLAALAPAHPYCAAVADAAKAWVKLLAGDVDPVETESAARALAAAGLVWDGARLAGQAAIRTTDRAAMVALLDCARIIQGRQQEPQQEAPLAADNATTLSDREREVAELVVSGLTYKQIGEKLFISAKTVEYHVARMRQRLGSDTRSDLLNQLRGLLGNRV
ncbi:MAG TPA: helix-turn-helix transcriptional regulator [Kutzneria sp.]|jgi:DNA-binding CsgD family transcriptional regulator